MKQCTAVINSSNIRAKPGKFLINPQTLHFIYTCINSKLFIGIILIFLRCNPTKVSQRCNQTKVLHRCNPTKESQRCNPTKVSLRCNPTKVSLRCNPAKVSQRCHPTTVDTGDATYPEVLWKKPIWRT